MVFYEETMKEHLGFLIFMLIIIISKGPLLISGLAVLTSSPCLNISYYIYIDFLMYKEFLWLSTNIFIILDVNR